MYMSVWVRRCGCDCVSENACVSVWGHLSVISKYHVYMCLYVYVFICSFEYDVYLSDARICVMSEAVTVCVSMCM